MTDSLDVLAPDIAKRVYVNPSLGPGGGNGTDSSPMGISDLISYVNVDTTRRKLWIKLKGDSPDTHYRGLPLQIDTSKYDEVTITTTTGKRVNWLASYFINSGIGAFTRPNASSYPNVWMCDNRFGMISGSTYQSTRLIDLAHSQACGLSGQTMAGANLYTDMGDNRTLAEMNDASHQGSTSGQLSGPYSGKILVHALGSVDPNTIFFDQAIANHCLLFFQSDPTAASSCRVNISGLSLNFGIMAGLWIDRGVIDIENCRSSFCHGYGFNFNQCTGDVASSIAFANAADGYNGYATSLVGIGDNPRLRFRDCKSLGNVQMLMPLTGIQLVGDGFSNHNSQSWQAIDCAAKSATKDGWSMCDEFSLNNCTAEDCVNAGVTLASQSDKTITAQISGGRFSKNTYGVQCNANSGSKATAQIDVCRSIMDSNLENSLILTGNRPATINAYDVSTIGPDPSGGHKSTSGNTWTGSAINVIATTPLT